MTDKPTLKRIEESLRRGLVSELPQVQPMPKKPRPEGAATYFEMSQNSIGMDNNDHAFLVGSGGPPPFPSPSYSTDPGLEPPLGEEVNSFSPVGTAKEIAASLPPEEEEPQEEPNDE